MISHGWLSSGHNVELVKVSWIPTAVSPTCRQSKGTAAHMRPQMKIMARLTGRTWGSWRRWARWSGNRNDEDWKMRIQGFEWTEAYFSIPPWDYARRQQSCLHSEGDLMWSTACCLHRAYSHHLGPESKMKDAIQTYPPTIEAIRQKGKSELSWACWWAGGSFLLHGAETDKMANNKGKGGGWRMAGLCCHTETNALTVNTSGYSSLDSYEHYETQRVGIYSHFLYISKVDLAVCM